MLVTTQRRVDMLVGRTPASKNSVQEPHADFIYPSHFLTPDVTANEKKNPYENLPPNQIQVSSKFKFKPASHFAP
jgi:hypothetical protein